jgi:hypothetical protein
VSAGARGALRLALCFAAVALAGCAGDKKPPPKRPDAPLFSKRLEATELMPSDLDLVLRFDMERLRGGLGAIAADELTSRAVEHTSGSLLKKMIGCAEVLWLGLRLGEIDQADHVAFLEGKACEVRVDPLDWKQVKSSNGRLTIFDRISEAPRAGTARLIFVHDRGVALVSPAEYDSVARLLRDGPDEKRADPRAEGLMSLDLRPRRLSPPLEKRYPPLAALIAGLERIRASGQLVEDGLELEAEVRAKTPADAEKALRFLNAVREVPEKIEIKLLMRGLKLERVDSTVRVRWTLPSKAVLAFLSRAGGEAPPAADKPQP